MAIRTRIVRIGNSQGIRIPKVLLNQLDLSGEIELEVEADRLVIRPVSHPRQGWEEQFRRMAELGDDALLDGDTLIPTHWDEEEWEW